MLYRTDETMNILLLALVVDPPIAARRVIGPQQAFIPLLRDFLFEEIVLAFSIVGALFDQRVTVPQEAVIMATAKASGLGCTEAIANAALIHQ